MQVIQHVEEKLKGVMLGAHTRKLLLHQIHGVLEVQRGDARVVATPHSLQQLDVLFREAALSKVVLLAGAGEQGIGDDGSVGEDLNARVHVTRVLEILQPDDTWRD